MTVRLMRLGLAFALCASLFACTKNSPAGSVGSRNAWTTPHVLRFGAQDEPDSLNPMFAHTSASDQIGGLIYTYLLRYDRNGEYVPDLATAVPSQENGGISKDGKTVTMHLRHGVTWSDGAALTAKDWIFTLSAVKNPRNNTKSLFDWDDIASADAPDPNTLVIHLKQPNAGILGILAMGGEAYPPLPAHLLEGLPDLNKASFNEHPISSGPFVLTAWNHGSSLIFAPNARYWRGKPKLAKIEWRILPDVNTLFAQLQSHEIDTYIGVSESAIARLDGISGITVTKQLIGNWRRLLFNTSRPSLRDPRVRLAIAEAIDWSAINATVYHGYNRLAVSDIYPGLWAAPNIPRYKYDVADAKRLLKSAGWTIGVDGAIRKGDQPMQLTISTGTNKQENKEAEVVIQQQLKQFGIDVTIRNYPVDLLFAQNGPLYTGKFDLDWTVDTFGPDPDDSGNWNSKYIPPHGANTAWLSDPIVDRTSDQAARTYDREARKALIQKEWERMHELVAVIPFYWETSYTATNSDVKNVKPAAFICDTWNAWEWDI
jgi:peptide/nickel transport system substrate-binding protein